MSSSFSSPATARTAPGTFVPDSRQQSQIKASQAKSWRVIHACEHAQDVLPVVEGQITVGMRPYIVTPRWAGAAELYLSNKDSEQAATLSLLRAWQDVRHWRKSLLECNPEASADVVHTHSFASGMAGVRNFSCVVYDFGACIDELAISAGLVERGSWMGRSFRVAEQFILSRAQAVVVHSLGMKAAAEERGAFAENVFLIPEPLEMEQVLHDDPDFLQQRFGFPNSDISYVAPFSASAGRTALEQARRLLEAFAILVSKLSHSRLLIETLPENTEAIMGHAEHLGIAGRVYCFGQSDLSAVIQCADVVVALSTAPDDPVQARRPNAVCLQALWTGKPLLAADMLCNRDCSPDGRGCLWFNDGDTRDLSRRMAFLGRNPDFRKALAAAGRAYIMETRNSTAVGQKYDAVYRHALKRKRPGAPGQQVMSLQPIISANW
jgi:glycosyltransferase involved in cell wall biosynthesis